MATITLTGRNRLFPVGTTVGIYPSSALVAGGTVAAGSPIVSAAVDAAGVLTLTHASIAAGTPYVAFATVGGEPAAITVMSSDSAAARGVALGTGDTTNGAATVANVAASSGAFVAGQRITGAGIPSGAFIQSVSGATVTLGNGHGSPVNATATATGVALEATGGQTWRARARQRRAALGTV